MADHATTSQTAGDDRFVELVLRLLDDDLHDASLGAELNALLLDDASRQRQFVALCLHARLLATRLGPELAALSLRRDAADAERESEHGLLWEVVEADRAARAAAAREAQVRERVLHEEEQQRSRRFYLPPAPPDDWSRARYIVIPRSAVFAVVAAMVVLAMALFWREPRPSSQPLAGPTPMHSPAPMPAPPVQDVRHFTQVATLVQQMDAQWQTASHQVSEGRPIYNESLVLMRGLAKLRFENGAEVVIEAPASFEPIADNRLKLHQGRLVGRCTTPDSRGFTVETPNARIVDLGTEFGIAVNDKGYTQAHVFEGSVELVPVSNSQPAPAEALNVGEARQVGPAGTHVAVIPTSQLSFVRIDEFDAQRQARDGSNYHRWLAANYELRRHPDLIAYYPFDIASREADQLLNDAPRTRGRLNGRLGDAENRDTRPRWTQGRFNEKTALLFDSTKMQRVIVPHDPAFEATESLTIAYWIRLNDFSDKPRTIVSKRGHDVEFQSAIYPARHSIQFTTSPTADGTIEGLYESRTIPRVAEWQMIVVTYEAGLARFYRNGELIDSARLEYSITHTQADLWIGMANHLMLQAFENPETYAFSGFIDELAIFSTALDPPTIRDLYETGRPD